MGVVFLFSFFSFFFLHLTPWAYSVGTDGLLCLVVTAIVWLGLILKVLIHVHVIVSIIGITGKIQGSNPTTIAASSTARLRLYAIRALDDGDGGIRTGWVAGAVWGQMWGWCSCCCHSYGTWVNSDASWTVAQRHWWLRPENQGKKTRKNCIR